MLIENYFSDNERYKMKKIAFEDCVRVDESLYMIERNYNAIYSLNIKTGNLTIVGNIPGENLLASRLGAKIIYHNDDLYFSPMNAKKIWRLSLKSKQWKAYDRKNILNWTTQTDMFQAIEYENKIFFIGCLYPAIIVLDTLSEKMEYIEKPYEILNSKAKKVEDACFRTDYVQIANYIYMASCVSNEVFKFDMNTYDFEFIPVGDESFKYSGIAYDEKSFFLSPRKNTPIVIWDGNTGVKNIELPSTFKNRDEMIFGGVCYDEGKLIFPACFWDKSIVIENKTEIKIEDVSYYFYKRIDEKTVVSLSKTNEIMIRYDGVGYKYTLEIDDKKIHTFLNNATNDVSLNSILKENDSVDLGMFINAI